MAKKVIETFISDLSGEQIEEGDAWLMTLTPTDGRRNKVELDISNAEAEVFVGKGREIKRRGRRPGTKMGQRDAKPDPK